MYAFCISSGDNMGYSLDHWVVGGEKRVILIDSPGTWQI